MVRSLGSVTAGNGQSVLGTLDGCERRNGDVMGQQSIRQAARRAALDAQSKRRQARAEREKRLEDLAVREREAAVADADRRAGTALRDMTVGEGLSVREAVEWCGDEITTREAARLRRLAGDSELDDNKVDARNKADITAERPVQRASSEDARGAVAL